MLHAWLYDIVSTMKIYRPFNEKIIIALLRWLVILIITIIVFRQSSFSRLTLISLTILALSNIALGFTSLQKLQRIHYEYIVFCLDTAIITITIVHSTIIGPDLIFAYFLTVFIVAISRNIFLSIIATTIIVILYLVSMIYSGKAHNILDTPSLVGIPFLYVVGTVISIFSKHTEKRQKHLLDQLKQKTKLLETTNEELKLVQDQLVNTNNERLQLLGKVSHFNKLLEDKIKQRTRELHKIQRELIVSERMATLGTISAGVAHEINNPLGSIFGYLDIINTQETSPAEKKEYLNRIETESNRISTIVKELLEFSRPVPSQLEPIDINTVVRETLTLANPQKSVENFEIELNLSSQLPLVKIDKQQLMQVLLNFIRNAGRAMEQRGKINIQTRSYIFQPSSKQDELAPSCFYPGDQIVSIVVQDNGSGIPKENLNRIFEPFFTTHGSTGGTGLGLAICRRIVENHGGEINADSILGTGTTFTINFPSSGAGKSETNKQEGK